MSEITDALAVLKTELASMTGSPSVWVWETEYSSIDIADESDLPAIIVSQTAGEMHQLRRGSTYKAGMNATAADIVVYLKKGFVKPWDTKAATASVAHPWLKRIWDELNGNRKLSNTVRSLGNGEFMFEYVIDNLIWKSDHYWGIYIHLPMVVEYISA